MLWASIFVFSLHLCPIIYVLLALVHRDMRVWLFYFIFFLIYFWVEAF